MFPLASGRKISLGGFLLSICWQWNGKDLSFLQSQLGNRICVWYSRISYRSKKSSHSVQVIQTQKMKSWLYLAVICSTSFASSTGLLNFSTNTKETGGKFALSTKVMGSVMISIFVRTDDLTNNSYFRTKGFFGGSFNIYDGPIKQ